MISCVNIYFYGDEEESCKYYTRSTYIRPTVPYLPVKKVRENCRQRVDVRNSYIEYQQNCQNSVYIPVQCEDDDHDYDEVPDVDPRLSSYVSFYGSQDLEN